MPIFGESASPYDEFVEKVTAETLTSENWELMINICDRVNVDPKGPKNCLISVKKRLNHRDPHVVLLALSLLDCLWSNCGQKFRHEVSSKEFISELSYKSTNSNRVAAEKARSLIKKWVENECKKDSSLSLVESLYRDLLDQGYSFEADPTSSKKKTMTSTSPNMVANDKEEADIAKAIALSLQESGTKKQLKQNNANAVVANDKEDADIAKAIALSLQESGTKKQLKQSNANAASAYPSLRNNNNNEANHDFMGMGTNNTLQQQQYSQSTKQVRALYDFEAVENNEISFVTGDIIAVIDDSDQNWWRGTTSRGMSGLFPASFVTTELKDSKPIDAQMSTQNDEKAKEIEAENVAKVQINENVLLKCIELIEGLDSAFDASSDPSELAFLENMAMAQAPLIDQKLMQIDKQLSQLADVDLAIRDVLGAYDNAVQQVAGGSSSKNVHSNSPQQSTHPPIPQMEAQIQGGASVTQSQIGTGDEGGGGKWQ